MDNLITLPPELIYQVKGKKVLFITTKNIDYIRNVQELKILKKYAEKMDVLYSKKSKYLSRVIELWFRILISKVDEYDVVFVGFAPQLIVPFWKRKFVHCELIIDFFISVYDTFVLDRKIIPDGSFASRICAYFDRKTLEIADFVIADTKAHSLFFSTTFNIKPEKFTVLYIEADNEIFYPRKNIVTEKSKFVVHYFGSMLPLQGIGVILGAIKELADKENITFDIVGPIPKEYCKPIQENVVYTEWVSQMELADHIARADLCLAGHFNADNGKARRTIPGKAYIFEMMQKRMILGDNNANRELFADDDRHIFVKMGDSHSLACLIYDLANLNMKKDNGSEQENNNE